MAFGFSRSRAFEYFYEEGDYSDSVIEYVLDHCDVNWKEQALQSALRILSNQPRNNRYTSYNMLIEDLTGFSGYTQEEAVYAADNCGADWKEQCCLQVKLYMEDEYTYNDDRSWIIKELKKRLFTDEEIEYALDKCGVK